MSEALVVLHHLPCLLILMGIVFLIRGANQHDPIAACFAAFTGAIGWDMAIYPAMSASLSSGSHLVNTGYLPGIVAGVVIIIWMLLCLGLQKKY